MKILLASASPRRKQILRDAGFEFDPLIIEVDESFHDDMPVRDVPLYLAKKKMEMASRLSDADAVVITADTVVILGHEIINKPADKNDAFHMLRKLSGKRHEVISAVCITANGRSIDIVDSTFVFFEELNDDEIHYYLDTCEPYDKAGAYAIQEWIGMNKIQRIEGNYFNVVGFPMHKVYKVLSELRNN